jgi:hypothetical protein
MADHPAGKQSTTLHKTSALDADSTSKLVSAGLVVLAILGVFTVFSDAIAAAWSPNAPATTTTVSAAAPVVPAPTPTAPPPATGAGTSP